MARLIWTEPALLDLDEIAQYIAIDDLHAAARYVRKVFDRVEQLEIYPNSGRRPPELARSPYREVIVPPCRIFYRTEGESIYILYIMRSERLLRSYLLDERNKEQ